METHFSDILNETFQNPQLEHLGGRYYSLLNQLYLYGMNEFTREVLQFPF